MAGKKGNIFKRIFKFFKEADAQEHSYCISVPFNYRSFNIWFRPSLLLVIHTHTVITD